MKTKTLTDVIGYEPNSVLIEMILEDVKATGTSLEEAASKYSMPVMVLPSDHGKITENGKTFTVQEFRERYPYRKIVTIREDV